MNHGEESLSLSGGEVNLWLSEDGTIHIKAITSFGDPVELSSEEAKTLADHLRRFANLVE
jgi:hypothetical protein